MAADGQTGAAPGGAGSFREALLAEARRHLDEAWVAYAIVNSAISPAPAYGIIMGRSRAEAVAAFLDFMETRSGAAVVGGLSYKQLRQPGPGENLVEFVGGFFECVSGGAWLSAGLQATPTLHFVSELRPLLRTKSAGKM